jgi:hypothetical protein
MSDQMLPELDTEPSSGVYIEHDDLTPTEEEIAEGNRMGETIDWDDDDDNGGIVILGGEDD